MSDPENQTKNGINQEEEEIKEENNPKELENAQEEETKPDEKPEKEENLAEEKEANLETKPPEENNCETKSGDFEETRKPEKEFLDPKKEENPSQPNKTENENPKETKKKTNKAKESEPTTKAKSSKKKNKKKVRIELEELNGLIKKIDHQTRKIDSLSKENEELRAIIDQNKEIVESFTEEVRIQKNVIDQNEKRVRNLTSENEDLKEENAEQAKEIQKAKEERRNLLERNGKLVKLWEEMEIEVKRTKASTVQLDCKNYELMEEKKDLIAELDFCRQEARQKGLIEGQIHELQRERLRLSRENEKFKNSKTIRKLKESEQTIGKLRKQVQVLTKQKNELILENKKFVGFSLKSQEDLRKNGDQVRQLEKQIEDLDTRNAALEKEMHARREEKEQKLSSITLRNIKLEAQNKSLKRNLGDVRREAEKGEARVKEKTGKMQKAMGELRRRIRELEETEKKGKGGGEQKPDLEAIKREKGILRDLAQQKNEMERQMIQSQSEKKRFKLKYEDALSRLKQKESHLRFICDEFIASSSIPNVLTIPNNRRNWQFPTCPKKNGAESQTHKRTKAKKKRRNSSNGCFWKMCD